MRLGANQHIRFHECVQRFPNTAAGAVFNRYNPEITVPLADFLKDAPNIRDVFIINALAEL
jgi:hypothetical protein